MKNQEIKIIRLKKPLTEFDGLESFNPKTQALILSSQEEKNLYVRFLSEKKTDLNQKFSIENIYSIKEFWKQSLKRVTPSYHFVPISSIQMRLIKFLGLNSSQYYENKKKIQTILSLTLELMSVFCHPNGFELLREYFSSSVEKKENVHFYGFQVIEEAYLFWKQCLKEKVILGAWAKGVLSGLNHLKDLKWDKELVFDLGLDLNFFTAELICELSYENEVFIFSPSPDWLSHFLEARFNPYLIFQNLNQKLKDDAVDEGGLKRKPPFLKFQETLILKRNISVRRHKSFFSESMEAVSIVKKWVNESIPQSEILILVPDKNIYHDLLKFYLEKEGIFLSHSSSDSSFHSFKAISHWISKMKIEIEHFDFYDLESYFVWEKDLSFEKPSHSSFFRNYEHFKCLFYPFLQEPLGSSHLKSLKKNKFQDYKRKFFFFTEQQKSKRKKGIKFKDMGKNPKTMENSLKTFLDREEFLDWAFDEERINGDFSSDFEKKLIYFFLNYFLNSTHSSFSLSLRDWVFLTENLSFEKITDVSIESLGNSHQNDKSFRTFKEDLGFNENTLSIKKGVRLENFSNGLKVEAKYVLILGLEDSFLNPEPSYFISPQMLSNISNDLGFPVQRLNSFDAEFSFYWFMEKKFNEVILSYPMSDFLGKFQSPSKIWMTAAKALHYDWESEPLVKKETSLKPKEKQIQRNQVEKREKLNRATPYEVHQWEFLRDFISLKEVEAFERCPFIFASRKLFSLQTPPDLKKEIDSLTQSQLVADLFKKLDEKKWDRKKISDQELSEVFRSSLEKVKEKGSQKIDERLLPFLNRECKNLSLQLLQKKENWNEIFDQPMLLENNFSWKLEWDFKNLDFKLHNKSQNNDNQKTYRSKKMVQANSGFQKVLIQGTINHIKGFWDEKKKFYKYILFQYIHSLTPKDKTNYKSWMKNNVYNLPISAYVIDQSLTSLPKGKVIGAFYFNPTRGNTHEKGFFIQEFYENSFSPFVKHLSLISENDLLLFYEEYKKKLNQTLLKISKGLINPEPENQLICQSCQWRKICRAPHLYPI